MSSLCSLSNLTITTRNAQSTKATRIEYDPNGLIRNKTSCARSVGTTIQLEKLFHSLPVRHKEFIKNLKREYHKLMYIVQSYCLISEGIKLSCFHVMQDKSTKLMSTQSTQSKNNLKSNIIEIFGSSAMSNMVQFDQTEPDSDILLEFKISKPPNKLLETQESESNVTMCTTAQSQSQYANVFKIDGYISDCGHNNGRSASDRQYIYVNKRPCDHSKITKLINEIFHQFNRNQYPMFVLNVTMNSSDVDVNVTPDKLQMFFKNENILLAIIKSSLLKMYTKSFKNLNLDESSLSQNSKILTYFSPQVTNEPKKTSLVIENISHISSDDEMETKTNEKKRTRKETKASDTSNSESPPTPQSSKLPKLKSATTATTATKTASPFFQPKFFLHEYSKSKTQNSTATEVTPLAPPASTSAFCLKDKLNLFQNRIGATDCNVSMASDLNESVAERIDLHLCNRQEALLDTPPVPRGFKRHKTNEKIDQENVNSSILDESTSIQDFVVTKKSKPTQIETPNLIYDTLEITQSGPSQLESTKIMNSTQSLPQSSMPSTLAAISKRKSKTIGFNLETFMKEQKEIIDHLKQQTEEEKINKEKELHKLIILTKNLFEFKYRKKRVRFLTLKSNYIGYLVYHLKIVKKKESSFNFINQKFFKLIASVFPSFAQKTYIN